MATTIVHLDGPFHFGGHPEKVKSFSREFLPGEYTLCEVDSHCSLIYLRCFDEHKLKDILNKTGASKCSNVILDAWEKGDSKVTVGPLKEEEEGSFSFDIEQNIEKVILKLFEDASTTPSKYFAIAVYRLDAAKLKEEEARTGDETLKFENLLPLYRTVKHDPKSLEITNELCFGDEDDLQTSKVCRREFVPGKYFKISLTAKESYNQLVYHSSLSPTKIKNLLWHCKIGGSRSSDVRNYIDRGDWAGDITEVEDGKTPYCYVVPAENVDKFLKQKRKERHSSPYGWAVDVSEVETDLYGVVMEDTKTHRCFAFVCQEMFTIAYLESDISDFLLEYSPLMESLKGMPNRQLQFDMSRLVASTPAEAEVITYDKTACQAKPPIECGARMIDDVLTDSDGEDDDDDETKVTLLEIEVDGNDAGDEKEEEAAESAN